MKASSPLTRKINIAKKKQTKKTLALFSASLHWGAKDVLALSITPGKQPPPEFPCLQGQQEHELGAGLGHVCSSPSAPRDPWQGLGRAGDTGWHQKAPCYSQSTPQQQEFRHLNVAIYSWHEYGLFFIYFTLLEIRECYFYASS